MVGSQEFRKALAKQLHRRSEGAAGVALLGGGPEAHRQLREEAWEDTLQATARRLRIALADLPEQKSAPDKVRLAAALKAGTSVSNGWLAQRLAMGQPASVSQFVRRFRLAAGP